MLWTLAESLDGKEIARRPRVSDKTESNRIKRILTRLGYVPALPALVFALHHGVVEVR